MSEFDTERTLLIDQHAQEMNDLQDIMFAMEQNFNERENDAKSEFQSMRDEIKNKVLQVIVMLFSQNLTLTNLLAHPHTFHEH